MSSGKRRKYDFKRWVESNFKLFVENTDYFRGHMDVQANRYGGEQTIVDYELSINMAEHLCLMSQTEKGNTYHNQVSLFWSP